MKKIGLVAGLGPESTIIYYKGIIDAFKNNGGGLNYPEIILYSANMGELMTMFEPGQQGGLVDWLVDKVEALERAGAEFAAIASNTPHVVFDEVQERSPLPLISILDETSRRAKARGFVNPGLLGTGFTMRADFYQKVFSREGFPLAVPDEADIDLIHKRLFTEIELGIIKDSTRQELIDIIGRMVKKNGIDSIILGCTELPLILDKPEYGVPVLDTTQIHVDAIVRECRG